MTLAPIGSDELTIDRPEPRFQPRDRPPGNDVQTLTPGWQRQLVTLAVARDEDRAARPLGVARVAQFYQVTRGLVPLVVEPCRRSGIVGEAKGVALRATAQRSLRYRDRCRAVTRLGSYAECHRDR